MHVLHIIKKNNIVVLLALLYCFTFFVSNAQSPNATRNSAVLVKGAVVDSFTQEALSHVSIAIKERGEINPLRTTLSNEKGAFEITVLPNKPYQLIVTHTGYKSTTLQFSVFSNPVNNIGKVSIASMVKQLKEVKVVTQKQIIEQDIDKIIYNVDADPESNTSTALDILRKIPLISVDAEDNLQLNGNTSYRILINGKPSTLFSNNPGMIFNNMPASAMKTIEVITTPSARYEAQGLGGIINITTYKKNIGGYNGGVSFRASRPKGYAANGTVTMTQGRLSFSGNYGYSTSKSPTNSSLFYRQDKMRQIILEQQGINNSSNKFQNWGGAFSWELSTLDLLTLSYGRNKSKGGNNYLQQADLLNADGSITQAYNNINAGNNKSSGEDFAIEYEHNFKKNEAQQLAFSYRSNKNTINNNTSFALQPVVNYYHRSSTTSNNDGSKEQSFQANFMLPIKKNTLEIGTDIIQRENSSDYFYTNLDTVSNAFILDTAQSNNYHHQETIYAAYSSLNLKNKKWGLRLGARMEKAKVDARFVSSGTRTVQKYMNLLPNIILSRQLEGLSTLKFAYTNRIHRPDLNYLDPYIDLTDPYNISFGNPNLQPALGHIFNLSYNAFIKKVFLSVTAGHQFINNSIQQFTVLSNDSISRTTFGNIGQNKNFSLSIAGNTTLFKKLNINISGMANYTQYTSTISRKAQLAEGLTYNISGALNLRQKNWRASFNMSYNAPNILVQGRTASYIANSLAINKFFLKDKSINIGLSINNLFQQYRRSFTEISNPTFYQLQQSKTIIRRFNLSFNYRFTKVQAKSKTS
jgi:hypothetical protein